MINFKEYIKEEFLAESKLPKKEAYTFRNAVGLSSGQDKTWNSDDTERFESLFPKAGYLYIADKKTGATVYKDRTVYEVEKINANDYIVATFSKKDYENGYFGNNSKKKEIWRF